MIKYTALLRGINVGGHHKVPMADLRTLLTKSGLGNVKTYIQSGNIAFVSQSTNIKELESQIHDSIASQFGFSIPVLVKTKENIERIVTDFPLENAEQEKSYYVLLHEIPASDLIKEASKKQYDYDHYQIYNDCIYLFPEKGYGQTKFNMTFFEKALKTSATARNHRTMLKLLSLHDD